MSSVLDAGNFKQIQQYPRCEVMKIKLVSDTPLKARPLSSNVLKDSEFSVLKVGTVLESSGEIKDSHIWVSGWVFIGHAEVVSGDRHINEAGLALIKQFEGLRLIAYQCTANVWTIGYGHTKGVKSGDRITLAQANKYLAEDVKGFEKSINDLVNVPLNDNQFSALVSFVFNVGTRAFYESEMLGLLNKGKYYDAACQFPRWNMASGKVTDGLVNRRDAEKRLFLKD